MSDNYERRAKAVRDLASQLERLRSKCRHLQSAQIQDQSKVHGDLATKTRAALAATKKLAQLLDGEFQPANPPPEMASTLHDLMELWKQTTKAAETCLDNASSYSTDLVQFHDAELGDWHQRTKVLRSEIEKALEAAKNALRTEEATLSDLNRTRMAVENALATRERELRTQRHKYDEADKYTWFCLGAKISLEIFKLIIEASTHGVENAERAVKTAYQQARDSESRLRHQYSRVEDMNSLVDKQAHLASRGSSLLSECNQIMGHAEEMEKEVARIKTDRFRAWQLFSKCFNRAEQADFALLKSDYATSILLVVEVALDDHTLVAPLDEIVRDLASHDDSKGSVRGIKTDEHPDGLLAAVHKKLLEVQQCASAPSMTSRNDLVDGEGLGDATVKMISDTSSLAVAHLRLVRSVATSLAIPKGEPGSVDLSAKEKDDLLAMLRIPIVMA